MSFIIWHECKEQSCSLQVNKAIHSPRTLTETVLVHSFSKKPSICSNFSADVLSHKNRQVHCTEGTEYVVISTQKIHV